MTAVMVLGGGGREHAIIAALITSPSIRRIVSMPGSDSINREVVVATGRRVESADGRASDPDDVLRAVRATGTDLVVIGAAGPSVAGVADTLRRNGVSVCGVGADAAKLEGSKAVGLRFMERHEIPCPWSKVFRDQEEAITHVATARAGCAVKLDGFAGGAGVFVCRDAFQARQAVELCFRVDANGPVVIQELCEGPEFSVHGLVSNGSFVLLDSSQDYKRLLDGDLGPNTGGMGSVSPVPWLPPHEYQEIAERLLRAFAMGCLADGLDYRGVVYFPVMISASGPQVLEINVRFGNPETQSLLSRLDADLLPYLERCANGTLAGMSAPLMVMESAVTVAACVSGYPRAPRDPVMITGIDGALQAPTRLCLSSGVKRDGYRHRARTGRVLTVTAKAPLLSEARATAYRGLRGISYPGMYFRTDIAGSDDHGNIPVRSTGCGVILLRGGTETDRASVATAIARVASRVQVVPPSNDPDIIRSQIQRALHDGDIAVVADDSCSCEPGEFPHICEIDISPQLPHSGASLNEVAKWVLVHAFASARTSKIPGEPMPDAVGHS